MTVNPGKREAAVALYLEGDKSTAEIAEEVGISRATLYNWLAAAGVSGRRHRSGVLPAPEEVDPEMAEAFTRMENRLDLLATEEKLDDICSKLVNFEGEWAKRRADMDELRHEMSEMKTGLARVQGALEAMLAMRQVTER
jgi:transposase-like protein